LKSPKQQPKKTKTQLIPKKTNKEQERKREEEGSEARNRNFT